MTEYMSTGRCRPYSLTHPMISLGLLLSYVEKCVVRIHANEKGPSVKMLYCRSRLHCHVFNCDWTTLSMLHVKRVSQNINYKINTAGLLTLQTEC